MKQCTICKKRKSFSEFYRRSAAKDGLAPHCKKCGKSYSQKYYHTHKVECAKYVQKYRKTFIGRLRTSFYDIRRRCDSPKNTKYKWYGARGIKCKFKNADELIDYVINNLKIDPRGLEIDRINNNGHYEPGNIRFVTHQENCNNRKR